MSRENPLKGKFTKNPRALADRILRDLKNGAGQRYLLFRTLEDSGEPVSSVLFKDDIIVKRNTVSNAKLKLRFARHARLREGQNVLISETKYVFGKGLIAKEISIDGGQTWLKEPANTLDIPQ